jgi:hypothetical protein
MASRSIELPDELAAHVEELAQRRGVASVDVLRSAIEHEVAGSDVERVLRNFPVFDSGCDEPAARDEDLLHEYGFGEW